MRSHRIPSISLAVASLLINGCYAVQYRDPMICQYPPGERPAQATVQDPADFELDRFVSDPSAPATSAQTAMVFQQSVWKDVKLPAGGKVGFRVDKGRLIAFAGPTTQPLEPGQYYWVSLDNQRGQPGFVKPKDEDVIQFVLNATIIYPTVLAFWGALCVIVVAGQSQAPR